VPARASEVEWQALAMPRVAPLVGAARVSVGEVQILTEDPWRLGGGVGVSLGIAELVAAGLLRRGDVHFVERRRFAAAAEDERLGRVRPAGAPAAGVSLGAEFILSAAWSSVGGVGAFLDVRLANASTGAVVKTWRASTVAAPDPTGLARLVVSGLVNALREMERLPSWTDPVAAAASASYQPSGVPQVAVESFLRGLAAEERWNWEGARVGYQSAIVAAGAGFLEAEAALARTARLRAGGTLGASQ
jgi:hypothetical protein